MRTIQYIDMLLEWIDDLLDDPTCFPQSDEETYRPGRWRGEDWWMGGCIYVCMGVCIYVCMYGWMDGWGDGWMDG